MIVNSGKWPCGKGVYMLLLFATARSVVKSVKVPVVEVV